MGDLYEKTLQLQKALATYDQAVRLKPGEPENLISLGHAHLLLGNKAAAMQAYEKLLTFNKDYAGYLLDDIKKGGPAEQKLAMADHEFAEDRNEVGVRLLQNAMSLKPNVLTRFNIGFFYEDSAKNYDEAIAVCRTIIALKPETKDLADAHFRIGSAYLSAKQNDKALLAYLEAQRIEPSEEHIRKVGVTYWLLEQCEKALASFQEAARLKPNENANRFWIGVTYREMKQYDKAVAKLLEAIRFDPKDPDILFALGMTYVAMGQKPQALRVQRTLLTLNKELAQELYAEINKAK